MTDDRQLTRAGWSHPARGVDHCASCAAAWAATSRRAAVTALAEVRRMEFTI